MQTDQITPTVEGASCAPSPGYGAFVNRHDGRGWVCTTIPITAVEAMQDVRTLRKIHAGMWHPHPTWSWRVQRHNIPDQATASDKHG